MAFEIAVEGIEPFALVVLLERLGEGKLAKINANDPMRLAFSQRARHVVGGRIGENQRFERQGLHVARGAADRVECPGAGLRRLSPIVGQIGLDGRRRQRRLEGDQGRDVAVGDGVGHAALREVVAAGPAHAEALDRLHAVVDVERVDGELPERGEHALAAEGPHDEIGIDAVDRRRDRRCRRGGRRSSRTARPWSRDRRARPCPSRAPAIAAAADRLQVRGHLARQ